MPEADRDDIRKIIYQGYRITAERMITCLSSLCCMAAVTSGGRTKKES